MPSLFFLLTLEETVVPGGTHSKAPIGGRPCLPLASKMTTTVHPCHIVDHARGSMLHLAPAALNPHNRCPATCSLNKKCPVSCSPSKWCLTSHSLRQRRPCPLRVCTCAGKDIPMVVDPASSCSPQQCQLAPPVGPAPLAVVFCSLERRAPVPSPSGVSTQPTLVLSLELASRAQVSVPSPCLSISAVLYRVGCR